MKSPSSNKHGIRTWIGMAAIPVAVVSAESLAWWWKNPPDSEKNRVVLAYSFPPDSEETLRVKLPKEVLETLFCDDSLGGWIDDGSGRKISVNYFEWNNTGNTGLSGAFGHAPEVCMGNLGNKVEAFLPARSYMVDGHELVFDSTQFRDEAGMPLYIFKLGWAEGMEGVNLLRDVPGGATSRSFRFDSVARRWFPRHARVLMLGVYGARDDDEAWHLVTNKVLQDLEMDEAKP